MTSGMRPARPPVTMCHMYESIACLTEARPGGTLDRVLEPFGPAI